MVYEHDQIGLKIVTLEPTDRCLGRCIMCDQWKNERGQNLQYEAYLKVISEAASLGVEHINLAGGDPLLYRQTDKIIKTVKKYNMEAALVTMGNTLTPKSARALIDSGVNIVRVSLDAPTAQTNNYIRGIPSTFERGVRGISLLLKIREEAGIEIPQISVNMTIMYNNSSLVKAMANFCTDLGVDYLNYGLVTQVPDSAIDASNKYFGINVCSKQFRKAGGEQILLTEGQVNQLRVDLTEINKDEGRVYLHTNSSIILKMISSPLDAISGEYLKYSFVMGNLQCPYPLTRLVIDAQGNAFPCSPIRYNLGNIREKSLSQIWTGQQRRSFIASLDTKRLPEICYTCCSLKPS